MSNCLTKIHTVNKIKKSHHIGLSNTKAIMQTSFRLLRSIFAIPKMFESGYKMDKSITSLHNTIYFCRFILSSSSGWLCWFHFTARLLLNTGYLKPRCSIPFTSIYNRTSGLFITYLNIFSIENEPYCGSNTANNKKSCIEINGPIV